MSSFRTLLETLRQYLQALSPTVEFSIVVAGAFGWPIFKSVREMFQPTRPLFSESHFQHLLISETVVLVVLLSFLRTRGWTLKHVGLWPNTKDTFVGLGLAYAAYMAYVAAWQVTAVVFSSPPTLDPDLVEADLRLSTLIVSSILNGNFEEIFVCGYVISAFERARRSMWTAIDVSIAIRLLCHLYQGAVGVISIIPGGLIFAYWYARTGRLWPLVVAHVAMDFFGFLPDVVK